MAIFLQMLQAKPLSVESQRRPDEMINDHWVYSNDPFTIAYQEIKVSGETTVQVSTTSNQAGDTCFLPWKEDKVCSMILPKTGGPSTFQTSSMTGCAFYIDKSGDDTIVYHANANKFGGGGDSPLANYQSPGAIDYLNSLYRTANAHYAKGSIIVSQRSFMKAEYFADVKKKGTAVINIAGFREAGNWNFWYQLVEGSSATCKRLYPGNYY